MLFYIDIALISVSSYYFLTLIWFIVGTYKKQPEPTKKSIEGVSVIVSVFNGENALPKLISDLNNQLYTGNIEFILVDDDSNDKTAEIIKSQSNKDARFRYVHSRCGNKLLSLKKRGLDAGIQAANFDILLFTDVDCHLQSNWVQGMSNYFSEEVDYVVGYSETRYLSKIITIFQKIDFMMLMFSARSTAIQNHPWACSGQNQAYRKSVYKKVGGFSDISDQLQGDDSLFLHLCRNKINVNVKFSEDKTTFVTSRPEKTWISFLKQRIRWSGDANIMWKFNKIFYLSILATFCTNFMLLILSVFALGFVFFGVMSIKLFLEFLLYWRGSCLIKQKVNVVHFTMWFFLQIPYIVAMGILSSTANLFSWRGRNI